MITNNIKKKKILHRYSNAVIGPALSRSPVFGNGFNDIRNSQSSLFQNSAVDPALVDEQTRFT